MRRRLSEAHKRKIADSVSKARKGIPLTERQRSSLKGAHTNRERKICSHCGRDIAVNAIKRHETACAKLDH